MPPESFAPEDPLNWIAYARDDLKLAHVEDVRAALLCFHAQQAAEKSVKAVLVSHGVEFPYTHNIAKLLHLVKAAGVPVPEAVQEAETLTAYAVGARYPAPPDEPISAGEYEEAVCTATEVVRWAESLLEDAPRS